MGRSNRDRHPVSPPTDFECTHCHQMVAGTAAGTAHRNHCPYCLWSLHVDIKPGDRHSGCRGDMQPVSIAVRPDGEWSIVHRCRSCGRISINRTAGDDDSLLLLSIALRPLALTPFPLNEVMQTVHRQTD